MRVLRRREGEKLTVVDGRGTFFHTVITAAHPKHCAVRIETQEPEPVRPYRIEMAVAPTKNMDRMEWFVEKAVELGIDRLTPLRCRCSERRELKTERLMRIAIAAMKQSLKATLPQIDEMTDLDDYLAESNTDEVQKFIAHCVAGEKRYFFSREIKPRGTVRVLIGPEGDFSDDEIRHALQAGYAPVSLGNARLRTETAALAAVHTVHLVNELTRSSADGPAVVSL